MATIRELLNDLVDFENTPASGGYDLRLSLAEIILRHLEKKEWTQKQLAAASGMKPSFITRIIHADSNCTFDVAGRLLHALNVKAELVENGIQSQGTTVVTTTPNFRFERKVNSYGQGKTSLGDISAEATTSGGNYVVHPGASIGQPNAA